MTLASTYLASLTLAQLALKVSDSGIETADSFLKLPPVMYSDTPLDPMGWPATFSLPSPCATKQEKPPSLYPGLPTPSLGPLALAPKVPCPQAVRLDREDLWL